MEIIKTNLKEEELTMETLYGLLEDEDRKSLVTFGQGVMNFSHYVLYEDTNTKDELTRTLAIEEVGTGNVFVTNSKTFISSFDRILTMAEKCNEEFNRLEVREGISKRNRRFLTAKYMK